MSDLKFSKLAQIGIFPVGNTSLTHTPSIECTTFLADTVQQLPKINQRNLTSINDQPLNDLYYGGVDTPTTRQLASKIASIEKGQFSTLTPSGQSAISLLLLSFLKPGDHILAIDTVIYSTKWLLDNCHNMGVTVEYFTPADACTLNSKLRKETKLIFIENPGSITYELIDICTIVNSCSAHPALIVIDNTWAASIFQYPLEMGADISLISMSKTHAAIEGVSLGALITRRKDLYVKIKTTSALIGNHVSSHTCAAAIRALSTLGARLSFQMNTTRAAIKYLESTQLCSKILHPTTQYTDDTLRQLKINGFNSLLTLELSCSSDDLTRRMNRLRLIKIGYGWGGSISLINIAETSNLPSAKRLNLSTSCVRLYLGLEGPNDLLTDLGNMLNN
ncbi:aminotransferase class I/II-fold pyridoxal phosphate-dependent enzyme [Pseudomonas sp. NPDC089407]|uniref:aminotransferase class I/II-fold pyridoxal phosphate-dependent enzyme n=1 Tax=Pseudomonas sp. NPDC089407 TaxID=3364464 RepID=UPI00384B582C